mgnify:CR=1 FL=1
MHGLRPRLDSRNHVANAQYNPARAIRSKTYKSQLTGGVSLPYRRTTTPMRRRSSTSLKPELTLTKPCATRKRSLQLRKKQPERGMALGPIHAKTTQKTHGFGSARHQQNFLAGRAGREYYNVEPCCLCVFFWEGITCMVGQMKLDL